ncbi:putative disease resistance protein RGA3 [Prosopis cineraria]|uniref:putative disease resistance protein RGA3 n=1 Tax=Prosopis cineraria TaxID=364024 RepID=UPI0024109B7F|nr:putative disease resistance protein RGA3 [Prosopis cineraria]
MFTQFGGSALTLESFGAFDCKSLRSMAEVKIDSLGALQKFNLSRLPNFNLLPQHGLPSNLRSILVDDCKGLSSMSIEDWGFQRMASLLEFWFRGDEGEGILHNLLKKQLLPTSLVRVYIRNVPNLKFLDGKGIQHLASLEALYIHDCPNLESLPEDDLPSSHLLLHISRCPELRERCHYQRGKHLSKIAHTPTIKINDQHYDS